ncbi:hypothetical protein HPP92_003299 [Vanilla planifolia]|uniref:Fe2OG dioxygenase domain-containing protein n=1 Tax=Vanilla planifolia TaxID=51239 RepID=A0A835VLC9_VANPL|nr:hypothetical protein HPP92_003299 [Vanilla planifolia]
MLRCEDQAVISDTTFSLGRDPSYPPLLPPISIPPPLADVREDSVPLDLPVIDLGNLEPARLGAACRSLGIFRLANHGMPPGLSARIKAEVRQIMELPFERKREKLPGPGGGRPLVYFWGTPAVSLHLRSLNWLEGIHLHLPGIRDGDFHELFADLGCSPCFRALVEEYGRHMARIVQCVFDSLSSDLKLEAALSESYLRSSDGFFRFYRYPRLLEPQYFLGISPHTDSSVLTIVDEDEVGGLQIRHGNSWFHIKPVVDTFLVQLGDMMQAISNDEYKSVEHRVLANERKERLSLCYFTFPREDFRIKGMRYREFSYGEYKARVQEDIKTTGDKIGLKWFRLQCMK